jgi:uncharacterized protein (TIGR03545 family)
MKIAIFRWKAVAPLAVFLLLLIGGWLLFGNWLVKRAIEAAGTAVVKAKVEIDHVHASFLQSRLTIYGLTVASPSESLKNVLQADQLDADFETLPLFQKKFIIDRLAALGLRFGTARATDGRVPAKGSTPVAATPAAPGAAEPEKKGEDALARLDIPVLQLATGKIDVGALDPTKLGTARAASALAARADSAGKAWNSALADLRTGPTVDSATALLARLKNARPTDLSALNDARRSLSLLSSARDRIEALQRGVTAGVSDLQHGLAALDSAKAKDFESARALVHLPPLDASHIGAALFGGAATAKFERTLHWVRLAREYMPAGLVPHGEPAPARVRRAGTTVHFPKEHELPGFLLKDAQVSFSLDTGRANVYQGHLTGVTTSPALYGLPATFTASAPVVQVGALLDHRHPTALDTASAELAAARLPDFALPGLPLRVAPGIGTMAMRFALTGDNVRAAWQVRSPHVTWVRDSAAGHSTVGDFVWQVVSGVQTLDLAAELSGTLTSPSLAVHSNLDDALSARMRALVGDQVKAAEAKLHAEVDAYADQQIAPVKSRVDAVTGDAQGKLGAARGQIAQVRQQVEQRLRSLTGGIKLP